jgi:hypothetical protein
MGNGPRRQRTEAWTWVYLALFGDDGEAMDTKTESADQTGEPTQETSDGPETR